jgi:HpcH/HpaI aldolase/citrate lyase family/DNA polymerase III subunit tau, C-terminal domain
MPLARSFLYVPANREKFLEKAIGLPSDAFIFDLEDSVPPAEKANARAGVRAYAPKIADNRVWVRVNGLDTALAEPDLDAVRSLWPAVLDAVRADNGLLAACLAEAHPVEVRGSEVVVAFAEHDTFNRKMADGREHRAAVDDALRDLAGSSLRVVYELRELDEEAASQPPSEDELVARFKTEFDAEEIVPDDPQPDEPEGQT